MSRLLAATLILLSAGSTFAASAEQPGVTWVRLLGDRIKGGSPIGAWPSGDDVAVLASTRGFTFEGTRIPEGLVLVRVDGRGALVRVTAIDVQHSPYAFAEPGPDGTFHVLALQYEDEQSHVRLFRFDAEGSLLWQRDLPHFKLGDGRVTPEALAVGADGSAAVIWRHPFGDGQPAAAFPLPPPRIALFGPNGKRLWSRPSPFRSASALAIGPQREVYAATGGGLVLELGLDGAERSRQQLVPRRPGEYPIVGSLVVSPSGRLCGAGVIHHFARRQQTAWPDAIVGCRGGHLPAWSRTLGGNDSDYATDIALLADDAVAVIGTTESPRFDGEETAGDEDMFQAAYGSDGTPGGDGLVLGGADTDVATHLAVDSAGGARFIVGSTESDAFAGQATGEGDALVVIRLR